MAPESATVDSSIRITRSLGEGLGRLPRFALRLLDLFGAVAGILSAVLLPLGLIAIFVGGTTLDDYGCGTPGGCQPVPFYAVLGLGSAAVLASLLLTPIWLARWASVRRRDRALVLQAPRLDRLDGLLHEGSVSFEEGMALRRQMRSVMDGATRGEATLTAGHILAGMAAVGLLLGVLASGVGAFAWDACGDDQSCQDLGRALTGVGSIVLIASLAGLVTGGATAALGRRVAHAAARQMDSDWERLVPGRSRNLPRTTRGGKRRGPASPDR